MSRRARQLQSCFAIPGNIHREAGFSQSLCEESHCLFFVFDQQNSHLKKHLCRIDCEPIAYAAMWQALSASIIHQGSENEASTRKNGGGISRPERDGQAERRAKANESKAQFSMVTLPWRQTCPGSCDVPWRTSPASG